MTYPAMPAVILAREGSQRLKRKWQLPWPPASGTCLIEHAIQQALACRYVDQVFVGSDSKELLERVQRRFGHDTVEPNVRRPDGFNRVETILRPAVDAQQGSLEGLRWCLEQMSLQASFALLVQATFPFLSASELDRLVETWQMAGRGSGTFLSKPGEPEVPCGAAWIVHPYTGYSKQSLCPAIVPCIDIDVREDYERAVAEYKRAHAPLAHVG